jgi:F5/8 type C domain-containing protein
VTLRARCRRWSTLIALVAGVACSRSSVPAQAPTELDGFESSAPWQARASDDVMAQAHSVPGVAGQALRLDFDFKGHGGHAGLRRQLPLELPENYEISLYVRGQAERNDLQFKLEDASGENVWWFRKRDFVMPTEWQRLTFKKRELEFAWGPTQDRRLRRSAALELVLAAGQGGRGSIELDRLSLRELPPPPATPPPPQASASSSTPGDAPALALDGRRETAWRSAVAPGRAASFELDLGYAREFGGLVLRWAPGAHASRYTLELSDDRADWRVVREVTQGNGGQDALLLPESEARFVRLSLKEGVAGSYGLAEVEIQELAFGATPNAFVSALARELPRGRYPRGFVGEQAYWTLVGVDAGAQSGLLSEDGALEVGQGGFSIEPFVLSGAQLISWADVALEHSLLDGYLPLPSVTWRHPEWQLRIGAAALGEPSRSRLGARYELQNLSARPLTLKLVLAIRPLQVNPPSQSLNLVGGVSPIGELAWDGSTLSVNGAPALFPLVPPDHVELSSFDAAEFPERLPPLGGRSARRVEDPTQMASGLLVYELRVPAGESVSLGVVAPLTPLAGPEPRAISSVAELRQAEASLATVWREKLNRVSLQVPAQGQPLVDSLRSALAHILMTRDGVMLRPGTRSYARSWIRDGAMMSESLLRLGHEAAVAEYLDWYAPFQFESGKVPCCVDTRGADPVPENDSPGELIFLAAELYRMTADRARLERVWPHVEAAARYLETLRQSERTTKNATPERRAYYGLLPPSISHEGYSDRPAYSYWDDFWGLIGYQDAAWIASELGLGEATQRLGQQRDEFRQDLYASLRASAELHGVPFLPGAADRGDFDATSTTIALAPGREGPHLPRDLLLGTFERYWQEFSARRDGTRSWDAYTPYELRVVGSFIRLGWRARAQELFEYFMADRRPVAWNQWAEVVGRDVRQPRFIGDMPHAWISSDYIRSVLDVFAYVRQADQRLVLAAGVPPGWFDDPGVRVRGLRTSYGRLDYSLRQSGSQVVLEVSGAQPPGGFALPWPWDGTPAGVATSVNGKPARWEDGELHFADLPARVLIQRH